MDLLTGAAIGGLACLALCIAAAVWLVVAMRRTPPLPEPPRVTLPPPLPPTPIPRRLPPGPLERDVTVRVLDTIDGPPQGQAWVKVVLRYDPADPYAVRVTFFGAEPVPWLFARDLLADALDGQAGEGDVRLWSGMAGLYLALSGPEGSSLFALPFDDVRDFVRDMYLVVPRGEEDAHVDLDAELARLLEGRSA